MRIGDLATGLQWTHLSTKTTERVFRSGGEGEATESARPHRRALNGTPAWRQCGDSEVVAPTTALYPWLPGQPPVAIDGRHLQRSERKNINAIFDVTLSLQEKSVSSVELL